MCQQKKNKNSNQAQRSGDYMRQKWRIYGLSDKTGYCRDIIPPQEVVTGADKESCHSADITSENRFLLCISPSSLSPFSVHVSMECRFSDRGDLVAEATASCAPYPPMREGN